MNEEKQELTGNNFIDAYNLGYRAGEISKQKDADNANSARWDECRRANKAEEERDAALEQVKRLKDKNKKLRKLLKKLEGGE